MFIIFSLTVPCQQETNSDMWMLLALLIRITLTQISWTLFCVGEPFCFCITLLLSLLPPSHLPFPPLPATSLPPNPLPRLCLYIPFWSHNYDPPASTSWVLGIQCLHVCYYAQVMNYILISWSRISSWIFFIWKVPIHWTFSPLFKYCIISSYLHLFSL